MILIDSLHRSEADLRRLGEQFRQAFVGEVHSAVTVYDNPGAIPLRNDYDAERLSKAQDAFYEKHTLGQYLRNGTTGVHQFVIFPLGYGGNGIKIDYR